MIKFVFKINEKLPVSVAAILFITGQIFSANLHAEQNEKKRAPALDLGFNSTSHAQEELIQKQNAAHIFQRGLNNFASIDQNTLKGSGNYASIEQSDTSANNHALIIQAGNSNQATITQMGLASSATIYQTGQGNRALISQH